MRTRGEKKKNVRNFAGIGWFKVNNLFQQQQQRKPPQQSLRALLTFHECIAHKAVCDSEIERNILKFIGNKSRVSDCEGLRVHMHSNVLCHSCVFIFCWIGFSENWICISLEQVVYFRRNFQARKQMKLITHQQCNVGKVKYIIFPASFGQIASPFKWVVRNRWERSIVVERDILMRHFLRIDIGAHLFHLQFLVTTTQKLLMVRDIKEVHFQK